MYNFAENSTICSYSSNLQNILFNLKHDTEILLECFKLNSLRANPNLAILLKNQIAYNQRK